VALLCFIVDVELEQLLLTIFSLFWWINFLLFHLQWDDPAQTIQPEGWCLQLWHFLWELVTGNVPFANMTAVQAAFAVVNKGVRPTIPHDCLPALGEIMTRCWDSNPEVRPPFTDIVRMLEQVEMEVLRTVRRARFRCCIAQPMALDWAVRNPGKEPGERFSPVYLSYYNRPALQNQKANSRQSRLCLLSLTCLS